MNQLIIADREEHTERNNEIFSENLIFNFSIYSPASDLLESLNREKVIINCDESNAKGLKLVPLGRSSLINTAYPCYLPMPFFNMLQPTAFVKSPLPPLPNPIFLYRRRI